MAGMDDVPNPVVVPRFESSLPSHSLPAPDQPPQPHHHAPQSQFPHNQKALNDLFCLIRQGAKDLIRCMDSRDAGALSPSPRPANLNALPGAMTPDRILALLDESELEAMAKISNTIGHSLARIMFMADGRNEKLEHRTGARQRRRIRYSGSSKHDQVTVYSTMSHYRHSCNSAEPPQSQAAGPDPSPASHRDKRRKTRHRASKEGSDDKGELRLHMCCHKCRSEVTPRWRRGPDGPNTLCNVCGLLYAKRLRRRLRPDSSLKRFGSWRVR